MDGPYAVEWKTTADREISQFVKLAVFVEKDESEAADE